MSLTTRERERIRLQEDYRHEIRTVIADRHNKESTIWKFLNSAFGLWLCSALIVSGGTFLYTRYRQQVDFALKRAATIEALDLEIGYRLSNALARLDEAQMAYGDQIALKRPQADVLKEQKSRTATAVHQLYYAPERSFPALYPEYSKLGLPALITELRRNESDDTARKQLSSVLRTVISDAGYENTELPPKNWIQKINKYALPRWQKDFDVRDPLANR